MVVQTVAGKPSDGVVIDTTLVSQPTVGSSRLLYIHYLWSNLIVLTRKAIQGCEAH